MFLECLSLIHVAMGLMNMALLVANSIYAKRVHTQLEPYFQSTNNTGDAREAHIVFICLVVLAVSCALSTLQSASRALSSSDDATKQGPCTKCAVLVFAPISLAGILFCESYPLKQALQWHQTFTSSGEIGFAADAKGIVVIMALSILTTALSTVLLVIVCGAACFGSGGKRGAQKYGYGSDY